TPLDSPLPLGEARRGVRLSQPPPVVVQLRSPCKRSAPGKEDVARMSIHDWRPFPRMRPPALSRLRPSIPLSRWGIEERGVRVLQAPPVAVHLRSPGKRSAPGNEDVARTSIRDWGPIPPDAAFGLIRATPLDSPLPLGEARRGVRVLQAPPVVVYLRSPGKRSAPGNEDVARTSIRDWGPIPPDAAFGLIRATRGSPSDPAGRPP